MDAIFKSHQVRQIKFIGLFDYNFVFSQKLEKTKDTHNLVKTGSGNVV